MEFENINQFENVISNIQPLTEELKVYGVYKKGETV
jgi:prephenate dehydratase